LLLLLELFLLFLLRHVMADGAAGRGAQNRVVTCNVSGHGADRGALEAAFGHGTLSAGEQHEAQQRRGQRLPFQRDGA
jgi:hypothetical protein